MTSRNLLRRFVFLLSGFCVVGGALHAQQIVLVPGTISGVITIGTLPITQINISAFPQSGGNSSSFSSSPNIADAPYSMTVSVPETGSVNYVVQAFQIRTDIGRDSIRFNNATIAVSANVPGTANFVVADPGFIQPVFTVNGAATISSVSLSASYSASGIFESASTSAAANTNFIFAAIPRNGMTVTGTVTFNNGVQVQLPTQTINVVANQTTSVAYTVDGSATGSIGGTVQFTGPQSIQRLDITASGPTSRSLVQQPPPANGAYSVGPLAPGTTYQLNTVARFNNFDDAFTFPNTAYAPNRFNLTVGPSETTVNVSAQQAFVNGTLQLTGGASLQPFVSGGVVVLAGNSTATSGGSSQDNLVPSTKAFDLIASPGLWRFNQVGVNYSRSAPSLFGSFNYFDNRPTNAVTLDPSETESIDIPIELGEVTLTLTVAGGGTFSNPGVSGSCIQRDAQNVILWQSSFSFSTSNQNNVQQGTVSFVTPAGQCTITPRVTINGQQVNLPNTTLGVVAGSSQTVDVGGPTLSNISPAPEAIIGGSSVSVSGRATDDVAVASVTVNGIATSLSSANNPSDPAQVNFSTVSSVPLQRGPNTITIVARDVATPQNTTTDTRTVYFDTALPTLNFTPASGFSTFNDTVTVSGTASDDAGVQRITVNGADVTFASTNNPSLPNEVSFTTTANLNVGSNPIVVVVRDISNRTTSQTHTVTRQQQAATTLAVSNASGAYNGTVTLTATLSSQGNGVSGKTIQFTLNGQTVNGLTNASGVASVSNVSLAGLDASSYPGAISASFAGDSNFNASNGTATLTVTKATATLTLGSLSHTFDGGAKAATVTTNPAGLTGVTVTYNGSTAAPMSAGSYAVVASLDNTNYQATNSTGTLVIAKATASIALTGLSHTYDGSPKPATATTTPGNLSGVSLTYNGSPSAPVTAGSYTVVATLTNNNYDAPPATATLNIAKANQTISFGALAAKTFGDADFTLGATASSGLPVTFAVASGSCTVNVNLVHITGAGSCAIRALQPGNANYHSAPDVEQPFTIGKADQTIAFAPLAGKHFGDADFGVNATATSGLAVTFAAASGSCTVAGNVVHITGAGSCTIRASQAGNANYNAAPDVDQPFTIGRATQTISFAALAAKTFGDADFGVSATASSGLAVTFTASGSCTVNVTSVHITGAGSCSIRASQTGDANYDPAPDVDRQFAIGKADQTITFAALAAKTFSDADFSVAATSSSGLTVTFTASGACSVSGSLVHITGAGSCTVRASQAGDTNYNAAPDVDQPFTIGKATQTITFGALANKTFGDADFSVSATASSGLTVTFAAASGACTVNGNLVHITGAGSCVVRASQAGNSNYNAAADVDQSFSIGRAGQTITFGALANRTFGDADFGVSATSSAGLTVTFTALGSCTVGGGTVHISGAGTCTIRASQIGDANHDAAPDVDRSFAIAKANQAIAITTGVPASAIFGTTFATAASGGGSGNPVTITTGGVCGVSAGGAGTATIQMTSGTGTCAVSYSQAGDTNYNPAATLAANVNAAKASQVITVTTTAPSAATFGSSFTVAATGGASGNPVIYTSPVGDGCSDIGPTFTMTSGIAACPVFYNQAGNANYSAAAQVGQVVNTVGFAFEGFFAPIDMPTAGSNVRNKANAGQAIPVKWRLTLNSVPVSSGASFTGLYSYEVSCTTGSGEVEDAIEEYAPGASGLTYDGDGRFHFNWKTPTTYKGKCRSLYVAFSDGSMSPVAFFKFN